MLRMEEADNQVESCREEGGQEGLIIVQNGAEHAAS